MAITLMYITNNPTLARIAQDAGVDRVWVDLEYKGKDLRQAGMNTVKSNHVIEDIKTLRPILTKSSLMVRVNPLDENSKEEIDAVVNAGAEYIMLPMFRTKEDVERFVSLVGGRAKTMLLLETKEAAENILTYVDFPGIDEIHIGLNDLHLAYGKTFMFELLIDGTVDRLAKILKEHGVKFGFGGFARMGYGMLPAEKILVQHYALSSNMAILSRGFCDANRVDNFDAIKKPFIEGVHAIREKEKEVSTYSKKQFDENYQEIIKAVKLIVEKMREQK